MDKVRALRVLSLVIIDALLVNVSVIFSLLLRFEFDLNLLIASGFVQSYLWIALVYTLVSLLVFTLFRLYSSLWAYAYQQGSSGPQQVRITVPQRPASL